MQPKCKRDCTQHALRKKKKNLQIPGQIRSSQKELVCGVNCRGLSYGCCVVTTMGLPWCPCFAFLVCACRSCNRYYGAGLGTTCECLRHLSVAPPPHSLATRLAFITPHHLIPGMHVPWACFVATPLKFKFLLDIVSSPLDRCLTDEASGECCSW
jgi:hypothetical protein